MSGFIQLAGISIREQPSKFIGHLAVFIENMETS